MFKWLSYKTIDKILTPEYRDAFYHWIGGQTVGVKWGKPHVYPWDFERWVIGSLRNGFPKREQGPEWD